MSFARTPHLPDPSALPRVAEWRHAEIWFVIGFLGLAFLFWIMLLLIRLWKRRCAREGVFRKYHLPEDEAS